MVNRDYSELKPDFSKIVDPESGMGLLPAVVQDNTDLVILMVGFMNLDKGRNFRELFRSSIYAA